MLKDSMLIWKLKQGSPEALARIYDKYEGFLITVAIALSNNIDLAEDVVHDVFVSFADSASRLKAKGNLKAYLAICVANRTRDELRRLKRQPVPLDEGINIAASTPDPEQLAVQQEQALVLNRALGQLPFEQKEVIVLHLHANMKFTH